MMKKQLLLLVMFLLPMVSNADDSGSCGENVTYTYTEATKTLVISGSGKMNDWSFPWLNNYNTSIETVIIENGVTSIGAQAFWGCSALTSVTIPNSVTCISQNAFAYCSGLTSIEIPNSVTTINREAFDYCSSLTSITIPNSVTSIGRYGGSDSSGSYSLILTPFEGCIGLTSIVVEDGNANYDSRNDCNAIIETSSNTLIVGCKNTIIPNSVTSICEYAFLGCSSLTSITIPNSVKSIGYYAFSGCSSLTSITIPNSVTSIGSSAFSGCSSLTSITIPNNLTSIGSGAFAGTAWYDNQPDGLVYVGKVAYQYKGTMPANTSITIKEGILRINSGAFYGCIGLTSITIPNSVMDIGDCAFEGCTGLTSITIPNSVWSIGKGIFTNCIGLTSITIPYSVGVIDESAFEGCIGLTSIVVEEGNWGQYDSRDNCNAIIEYGNKLIVGCKNTIIPNSVTSIGGYAFRGCSSLTSITIPNSVKSIVSSAFFGCSGLTSMVVEDGNTKYDSRDDCNAIIETSSNTLIAGCKNTVIPNSVTSIGGYAFYGCDGLTSITIPNSVISIGGWAFQNCSGLTSVTIEKETPLPIYESTFSNRANAILYVPKGSKAAYEAADYWNEFKKIVEIGETITPITESEEINFSEKIDENTDLSSVVIDNIYITVDATNGDGYDATKQALVLNSTTSTEQMNAIQDAKVGDDAIRENYNGIIFELAPGKGVVSVDVQTIGTHMLMVQIGNNAPTKVTKSERGTVDVPYDVSEPTYVYLYASTEDGGAARLNRAPVVGENSVVLYGYKVTLAADLPVTITAKDYTIKYGDDLPAFEYTSEGAELEGTPSITCEATKTSPVGTYPIVVSKGSVTNPSVTCVNGTLTIEKAPLSVKAEDATREEGEENPLFVISYSGWKNDEDESVLTTKPTATTDATKDSPVGDYAIVVSGGAAQNYELSYTNGVLTITEASSILGITVDSPANVYDLKGNKVRSKITTLQGLPKGVYIINGKKVVVK